MMISGDRVIWRSGDRKSNPTAETLRRGGEQWPNLTTETRRHGGKSGDRGIGKPGNRDFGKSGHLEIGTSGHRKSSDHPITRDHPTRPDLPRTTRLRNAWNVLQAVVQEIFDESAYRRFLARTGLAHSTASYRAFQRERDAAAGKRARCC